MSKLIGWIPVSERLPSKDDFGRVGFYLVTCYDDDFNTLIVKASVWGPVENIDNLSDTCKKYTYDGWAFGVMDLFSDEISYVDFAVAWTEMPDAYMGEIVSDKNVGDMLTKSPSVQQEPCEDAVSRQAVINIINKPVIIKAKKQIEALPSVHSERKTGHWINILISVTGESEARCDQCGCVVHNSFSNSVNYCPNCGADMRGDYTNG